MMKKVIPILLLAALFACPALAQSTAEAKGKVVDDSGAPVAGAEVVFTNARLATAVYRVKTDKKGTFWIPNLAHIADPNDKTGSGLWLVQIEAEGYAVAKLHIETRRGDRTLMGDPYDARIRLGGKPAEVRISGLGEARIDATLLKVDDMPPAGVAQAVVDPWDQARDKIQSGDLEGSIEFFRKAIEAKPEEGERKQLLAYTLYKLGRLDEAEAEANRAAAAAPDKPGANLILSEIYKARGDTDRAWVAIQRERTIAPESVPVLERVTALATEMGRPEEALAACEAIVKVAPTNAEAWVTLGGLYAERGENEKSEAAFRKVVDLDPASAARTFYNIGVVIANKPDLSDADNKRAAESFRKALGLKPDYAAAQRELGFALLRANDSEGAKAALTKFLELEPTAPDAGEIRGIVSSLGKK